MLFEVRTRMIFQRATCERHKSPTSPCFNPIPIYTLGCGCCASCLGGGMVKSRLERKHQLTCMVSKKNCEHDCPMWTNSGRTVIILAGLIVYVAVANDHRFFSRFTLGPYIRASSRVQFQLDILLCINIVWPFSLAPDLEVSQNAHR